MRKVPILLFTLFVMATSLAHADLKLYTENSPPFNFIAQDGKLDGTSVAIVKEIQKRIDDKTPIELVPWARGYQELQKDPNVALFSTAKTPEREKLFKWVGPLVARNWIFVKKKGSPVVITSLEDAKKLKAIGTYNQDAKEQYLKSEGFTNLQSANSDDINAKKLVSGRFDAWFTGEESLKGNVEKAGEHLDEFEISYVAKKTELYLAFSLKTDDTIIKKWQEAFDSMVKDGTYSAINKKYGTQPAVK